MTRKGMGSDSLINNNNNNDPRRLFVFAITNMRIHNCRPPVQIHCILTLRN